MAHGANYWIRQVYLGIIPSYPLGYMLINGFRGDQFWTKFYVERSAVPPSEHLKDLVEAELDKITDLKNAKVKVALTDRAEPRVYGGFFLTSGAELQFPVRVSFGDVEEARRLAQNVEIDLGLASPALQKRNTLKCFWEGVASNRRKIEVNSKVGEELISRMMLSDAAKMFLVQRELQLANSGVVFCAPMLAWFGIFSAGYAILLGFSSFVGVAVGSIVSVVISACAFRQFLTAYNAQSSKWADGKVVEMGEEYLQGARDYFRSTMKFNRLLRVLLGEEGEKNISKTGDVMLDPIPLSARLKNVEELWKRRKSKPEDTSLSKFY